MKTYFFISPVYTGEVIKNVIERDYINIVLQVDLHQQLIIQD